jgi:hypothetical protein
MHKVNIDEAFADQRVTTVLAQWGEARRYPDAPPFAGGVMTDWPAIAVDGFAVCREEEWAIDDFQRWKEGDDGRPEPAVPG